MDKVELKVNNRDTLGKKVRLLRRQGITPVHLFGHGIESVALQCHTAELKRVLAQAGKTTLINLKLDNEKSPRAAVVREVQREHLKLKKDELLHVDFYQVRMDEEMRTEVPIVLVGEAPALKLKGNMLIQDLDTLTVECLPDKIPHSIEIDLSSLTQPEQMIRVKDIEVDRAIAVINDPELVVVKVTFQPVEKEIEEKAVPEEAVETPEAAALREEKSQEE